MSTREKVQETMTLHFEKCFINRAREDFEREATRLAVSFIFLFSQAHTHTCLRFLKAGTCNKSLGTRPGSAVPGGPTTADPVIHEPWARVMTRCQSEGCYEGATARAREPAKGDPSQESATQRSQGVDNVQYG